ERAVELAERKTLAFDVADHARCGELARGVDDAADDSLGSNGGRNGTAWIDRAHAPAFVRSTVALEIPPRNAVLHRQDDAFGVERATELGEDRRDLVGLHREHHQIVLAGMAQTLARRERVLVRGSVALDERETVAPQGVEVRAPRDQRHFGSGARPARADEAADRAGADDADALH